MAAQALLHQQWLCFSSNPISTTTTRPWLPARTTTLSFFQIHKKLIPCSSSSSTSQSPEANTETAESCVNLGLQLFSKGRVWYPFHPISHCHFQLCLCEMAKWVCFNFVFCFLFSIAKHKDRIFVVFRH